MKDSMGDNSGKSGQSNQTEEDDHLYQLIRGVPTVIIARGGNEEGPEFRPLPPQTISRWDLDDEIDFEDDEIDFDELDLVSPEKFEAWRSIRDQEKYREYLRQDDAKASSTRNHAWRDEKTVDFTVSLMASLGSPKGSSDESSSSDSNCSHKDDDSSSSETESSGEDGSSNVSPKRGTPPGQSNFWVNQIFFAPVNQIFQNRKIKFCWNHQLPIEKLILISKGF